MPLGNKSYLAVWNDFMPLITTLSQNKLIINIMDCTINGKIIRIQFNYLSNMFFKLVNTVIN